jgi:hypothetical protein
MTSQLLAFGVAVLDLAMDMDIQYEPAKLSTSM